MPQSSAGYQRRRPGIWAAGEEGESSGQPPGAVIVYKTSPDRRWMAAGGGPRRSTPGGGPRSGPDSQQAATSSAPPIRQPPPPNRRVRAVLSARIRQPGWWCHIRALIRSAPLRRPHSAPASGAPASESGHSQIRRTGHGRLRTANVARRRHSWLGAPSGGSPGPGTRRNSGAASRPIGRRG